MVFILYSYIHNKYKRAFPMITTKNNIGVFSFIIWNENIILVILDEIRQAVVSLHHFVVFSLNVFKMVRYKLWSNSYNFFFHEHKVHNQSDKSHIYWHFFAEKQ